MRSCILSFGCGKAAPRTRCRSCGEKLLETANKRLDRAYAAHPLALTIEIHEITHLTFRQQHHPRQGGEGGVSKLDQAIARADGFLGRFRKSTVPHLIDGKPDTSGGKTFETASPVDNSMIAKVARGGNAEIDRAAKAATKAFRTSWSRVGGEERRDLLHKIADAIEARADEIAHVECMDTGQPIRYMSKAALRGAENFRFYADRAPNASDGLSLPTDTHLNYTLRQPIGPVGVITPWNTPFMLSTWKIAPALAAGCTVVHKPAEWSPLTATLLAEICLEAGLPAGVLNVVHGLGEEAGRALTEHPDIKAIGFVGESTTGSRDHEPGRGHV